MVLLEQHRIGWGASGRSGAQAIHGVASGQNKLERLIGRTAARAVWDVSIEGLALMRQLITRHHIECDWVDGYMLTAVKPRHDRELRVELAELQREAPATAACATCPAKRFRQRSPRTGTWARFTTPTAAICTR